MKGVGKNDLYVLKGVVVSELVSIAERIVYSSTKLWDKRLGHVSEKDLVELDKQGLLGSDRLINWHSVKTTSRKNLVKSILVWVNKGRRGPLIMFMLIYGVYLLLHYT